MRKKGRILMDCITLKNVKKDFITGKGDKVAALGNVNLSVPESEFVCILGPSGCGKSTLLRIIAGLESATEGEVIYRGKPITGAHKEIGMVFQNYSLMPWLNVRDNIALGLDFAGIGKKERLERAEYYMEMIHMQEFAKAFPYELSGGMQQRVAIARALANDPDVLLMDEPFGALDAYTRIVLQQELLSIWEKHKKTILFVTHSVDEAIYLADRVIFMAPKPSRIEKEFLIDMPRIRQRNNPRYGELTEEMLALFEKH
ncbi:MAG: ABC transporter ATP-binding protein [Clostridium sp.]|uniref:ABC transporter ATP-binding protein n=2 Tax=Clostridium culturomicium TaxID=1499683 RepID=UPI0005905A2B|nr:ABC transporter ATP-binding protein [Clostridium culturomicium]MDU4889387.1 ABC transporter ATP-binding protein [Clostridium sp.]MDU7082970.1 ABC transporter ATP-binding protein [Clostridium sp.]